MANILYGVCGEGSGHASRSKVIIRHLLSQGHRVHIVSYGKGIKNLSPHFEVNEIYGLHLTYENNEVQYLPTVLKSIWGAPAVAKSVQYLTKFIEEKNINLVITDFEPLSCYVANVKKIPVISIDNQHAFTKAKLEYPKQYKSEAVAVRMVTKMFIPKAASYLALTFFPEKAKDKKTFFFPPVLRPEIFSARPSDGDFVLAYFTSSFTEILPILKTINKKFVCYGLGKVGREGNVICKKPSEKEFLKDLIKCDAVIANAGFTLVGEALHLGKPYLAIPVKSQFEQVLNAYYVEKLGFGRFYDDLDREKIESFLFNVDMYKKNLKKYKRQNNDAILKKLDELILEYSK